MKIAVLVVVLLLPIICCAQITGVGKLKVGQPITTARAYDMLARDKAVDRKIAFDYNHPNDSTYAEVSGLYNDIGLEIHLTVFKKRLSGIRISCSSLDISGIEDKQRVDKYQAFIDGILKKYGNGNTSARHTPYSCKCYGKKDVAYDNADITRKWQSGTITATLITREQTNALSNKCITSWGMNFSIADESVTHSINQFFRTTPSHR